MKINTKYLRNNKAAKTQKLYSQTLREKTNLTTKTIKNATVLPLKMFDGDNLVVGRGGVVDNLGNYCDISGYANRQFGKYDYQKAKIKHEKVVYGGYFIDQWGHFLIECIPRLWYVLNNENVEKIIFITNGLYKIHSNFKRFFEYLGIYDKIELIEKVTTFDEVIIPEMSFLKWEYYSHEYINIINTVINNALQCANNKTYKKIFLSRYKFWRAKEYEFGLDMLENYYAKNGYIIIYPEQTKLSNLINYLQNADEIVAMSGSLAHTALFALDNSNLTIIERNALINNWQININKIKNLNVTYIDAVMPIYPVHIMKGPYIIYFNDN